jgi:hypothetical protein
MTTPVTLVAYPRTQVASRAPRLAEAPMASTGIVSLVRA